MKRFFLAPIVFLFIGSAYSQPIPKELWGRWVIRREISTGMISCWGDKDARRIIGTEIEYSEDSFRWKNSVTKNPAVKIETVTADRFHDEYSGKGSTSSQVTFQQLGITTRTATQVEIEHPGANVVAVTPEIPGDIILIKNRNTIVFSVCSLFFEAKRIAPH